MFCKSCKIIKAPEDFKVGLRNCIECNELKRFNNYINSRFEQFELVNRWIYLRGNIIFCVSINIRCYF